MAFHSPAAKPPMIPIITPLTRPISLDNDFFHVLRCTRLQAQTASFGDELTIPNHKPRRRIKPACCAGFSPIRSCRAFSQDEY